MRFIQVFFSDGRSLCTSINGTEEEIRLYYLGVRGRGQEFNLGDPHDATKDSVHRAVAVEFVDTPLGKIKATVRSNSIAGRSPYEGMPTADIAAYNRALMFGDNDEAFPSQAEWSRIVD